MTAPEYLTPEEVRDRLRLRSAETLAHWRNKRKGPPFRKFGSRVLYPIEALLDWERKQTVETRA
ncbi:helix-turn-helix domain-containing protein [Dyella kyungheensis]|uniref:helix-turn-helix domain-containing protein n=1 Tax=Dyella kyungheensis TaxID=1242174 RepID=UPI003CEB1B94